MTSSMSAVSTQSEGLDLGTAEKAWLKAIEDWYPDRHKAMLFCNPVHFNRVPFDLHVLPNGQCALVPQNLSGPKKANLVESKCDTIQTSAGALYTTRHVASKCSVQASDIADDKAIEKIRKCIEALGKQLQLKGMMTILGLKFQNYLNNTPVDVVRPCSMSEKDDQRDDFDLLIIHLKYGFLLGEVKSLGGDEDSVVDSLIMEKRIQSAIRQLNKGQKVLKLLTADLGEVPITKTLLLPNVTREKLVEFLANKAGLLTALKTCLGTDSLDETVNHCLWRDRISPLEACLDDPLLVADRAALAVATSGARKWWEALTERKAGDVRGLSSELYDKLLARCCGPATTVEVPTAVTPRGALRTMAQATALTSLNLSLLILHQEQVAYLNDPGLSCAHLYGPPGTGKTILAVLKASEWLQRGKDVQVVSVQRNGRATSFLIEKQLSAASLGACFQALGKPAAKKRRKDSTNFSFKPCAGSPGRVRRHSYNFLANREDLQKAVGDMKSAVTNKELFVVIDEVLDFRCVAAIGDFCKKLKEMAPGLHLWCTSLEKFKPTMADEVPWIQEVCLNVPLRTPPCITREVRLSKEITQYKYVADYARRESPEPTDGPSVQRLPHFQHPGHAQSQPEDCPACAEGVMDFLSWHVRKEGSCLKYRDVFILCQDLRPGKTLKPLLDALHEKDIDYKLVTADSPDEEIRDLALATNDDVVVVADYAAVTGLERAVVVAFGKEEQAREKGEETEGDCGRLLAMSRCNGWLVLVGTDVK